MTGGNVLKIGGRWICTRASSSSDVITGGGGAKVGIEGVVTGADCVTRGAVLVGRIMMRSCRDAVGSAAARGARHVAGNRPQDDVERPSLGHVGQLECHRTARHALAVDDSRVAGPRPLGQNFAHRGVVRLDGHLCRCPSRSGPRLEEARLP